MILKRIRVKEVKPSAFKDREDIEYVQLEFDDLHFIGWAKAKYIVSLQIPKGCRDLSALLLHIFTEYIPIGKTYSFNVSIPNTVIKGTEWKLRGGTYKSTVEGFTHWTKMKYRKHLKEKGVNR